MLGRLTDLRSAAGEDARPGYVPALDGLRAVSVAAVVAFHLGHLRGGFLGVDVFFVISGFLITRLLVAEVARHGAVDLRAFWGRRFRRLLPALLVVLAATAVAGRAWLPAWRLGSLRADGLSALAYVANWRFAWSGQSYFADGIGPSPLRHLWSLAIEEQFYVVWPVVVVLLVRGLRRRADAAPTRPGTGIEVARRRIGAVAAAASVASATWMAVAAAGASDLSRVYYGTDTRVFAISAGAWLATLGGFAGPADRPAPTTGGDRAPSAQATPTWGARLLPTAGTAVLVLLVATTGEDAASSYRWAFQLAAVASVATVAGLAAGTHPLGALLGSAPFRWLGRRSYGIYLWSWPTQVFAQERFGLTGGALALVTVGVSIAAAAISFRFVEEPVRLGRTRLRDRDARPPAPVRRPVVGAASFAAVGALLVAVAMGAPRPPAFTTVSDDDVVAAAIAPPASVLPRAAGGATAPGATAPTPLRVLVVGDSVGWSLGDVPPDALGPNLVQDNRALVACGPLGPDWSWVSGDRDPNPYEEHCALTGVADQEGLAGRPDVVLLWLGAWDVYDQVQDGERYRVGSAELATLLEDALQARIDRYRAAGVPTVLARTGCFGEGADWLGDERHQPARIDWVNARQQALVDRNPGWVYLVDPTTVLCDDQGDALTRTDDGIEVRPDGTHFDQTSATWLWRTWLGDALRSVVADR